MGMVVRRFEVYLVRLDPTDGREIRKTRPCLIISPNEMNKNLGTVIMAPMTTKGRAYPSRVPCNFAKKSGYVALDQLRSIDKSQLIRRLGMIKRDAQLSVLITLAEMFAE